MSRGDKSKYTGKQKRKAEHIAESYEERGIKPDEAEARAWATVNKQDGGGKLGGRLAKRAETNSTENRRTETKSTERKSA